MMETVTMGRSVLGNCSMPSPLTEKRPSTTSASMMQTVKTGLRMERSERNMSLPSRGSGHNLQARAFAHQILAAVDDHVLQGQALNRTVTILLDTQGHLAAMGRAILGHEEFGVPTLSFEERGGQGGLFHLALAEDDAFDEESALE